MDLLIIIVIAIIFLIFYVRSSKLIEKQNNRIIELLEEISGKNK
ncbi:hypothetical protein QUF94_16500 [Peribacillus sp. NJ4]|nr:hypothetical protein [Peribacillus sp. NJ4]MDM5213019.1 hypothetical protein [Peribacillus sp. NJ4]